MNTYSRFFWAALILIGSGWAADLNCPGQVTAGKGAVCHPDGSGTATLYVSGPGTSIKREVALGEDIALKPEELRAEGRYMASLGNGATSVFFVTAASPAAVVFMARPSRVPAAQPDAITGSAFVYDDYKNLVLAPVPVTFAVSVNGGAPAEHKSVSQDGVAYVKYPSPAHSGAAQFIASAGGALVRRVVTVVASDPCRISISAHRDGKSIVAETAPLKDCSGNEVPDGTIVTFTETERGTALRSQVDAPSKHGVARARLPLSANASLSAASGVVVGNELNVGGSE